MIFERRRDRRFPANASPTATTPADGSRKALAAARVRPRDGRAHPRAAARRRAGRVRSRPARSTRRSTSSSCASSACPGTKSWRWARSRAGGVRRAQRRGRPPRRASAREEIERGRAAAKRPSWRGASASIAATVRRRRSRARRSSCRRRPGHRREHARRGGGGAAAGPEEGRRRGAGRRAGDVRRSSATSSTTSSAPSRPSRSPPSGMWYEDFSQTTDEEVRELLDARRSTESHASSAEQQDRAARMTILERNESSAHESFISQPNQPRRSIARRDPSAAIRRPTRSSRCSRWSATRASS